MIRTQKGTSLREKRIFNAEVELLKKMDKLLLEFADELVTFTTFEHIEKLFVECANDAVTDKIIKRHT